MQNASADGALRMLKQRARATSCRGVAHDLPVANQARCELGRSAAFGRRAPQDQGIAAVLDDRLGLRPPERSPCLAIGLEPQYPENVALARECGHLSCPLPCEITGSFGTDSVHGRALIRSLARFVTRVPLQALAEKKIGWREWIRVPLHCNAQIWPPVNRWVAGSSPARGGNSLTKTFAYTRKLTS